MHAAFIAALAITTFTGCATASVQQRVPIPLPDDELTCRTPAEYISFGDNVLSLQPGESACIRTDRQLNRIRLAALASAPGPDIITFQIYVNSDKQQVLLKVHNPYDAPLKYALGMIVPGESTVRETSSCPVLPGAVASEHQYLQI